ncbi:MAG: RNA pseudouridine synthase [Treponema sp.]|nr:RNA pseudouridine synthase [Treponema sp.]
MKNDAPYILEETGDYAVVFKPAKIHSAPLAKKESSPKDSGALLEWYASHSPPVIDLMHRLDFETHGLVLFAKNSKSYEFFSSLQDCGGFVKEYSAVCSSSVPIDGFPPPPALTREPSPEKPLVIESYFRPFGPGRKQVRPVIEDGKKHREVAKDSGSFYRTEIIGRDGSFFTLRIKRGFRHQIRCHLCWIGFPILNDSIYNSPSDMEMLALRAHALFFTDPSSGEPREYRIAPLDLFEKDLTQRR